MNSIKLSICIPTYNRAESLRDCLDRCVRELDFGFPFEIVISDNASTDHTTSVVQEFIERGAPIRYHKGDENVGMIPNVNSAFRLGRGEYLLYLADDDRLIGEEIAEIVAYLDQNPNTTVCHAPWFITDGVTNTDGRPFYHLAEDVVFPRRSYAEVFNFLFRGHVFPEIAVYRRSAIRSAWAPRSICFFAFPLLAHLLDQGDVAFRKKPFYRQVIRSAINRDRQQGGHDIAMTGWDQYRGGLEYFLYFGIKRGRIGTSLDDRTTQEHLCKVFTMERMAVAIRLLIQRGEYLKSYELLTRMEFSGHGEHQQLKEIRNGLPLAAALETLAWQIKSTAGIRSLIISGFLDTSILKERLMKVGFPEKIEIVGEPAEHTKEFMESAAVLVSAQEQRDHFLELGYLPNMVFSQEDLVQTILV
ncbi:glycosyltransferase family 2 protein [Rhizobium puerariae]|uniref:Glycosyltransferase family 2 protein n=1 Tax=Rhizobium puerariae TaxID=1585791 RepID=A0ABV6AHT2_9HYPH